MANQIPELRDLLSHHMLNSPYDPSSNQPERWLIDHLVEQVIDWEIGSTSTRKLASVFEQHKAQLGTFDILLWIESKAAEGEYDDPWADDET